MLNLSSGVLQRLLRPVHEHCTVVSVNSGDALDAKVVQKQQEQQDRRLAGYTKNGQRQRSASPR